MSYVVQKNHWLPYPDSQLILSDAYPETEMTPNERGHL
jgi:hypothetical protein